MHPAFEVHILNENGILLAKDIATSFDNLLTHLSGYIPEGRELAIVRTKLEEACFFAKKGMASDPENQK